MGQRKSNEMATQLIEDILRETGAQVQQRWIQEFLEFIEQLCHQFFNCRTLDAPTWKDIGIKILTVLLQLWTRKQLRKFTSFFDLIQEKLDLSLE